MLNTGAEGDYTYEFTVTIAETDEVFNNGDTQVTNAQVTLNVIDQSTSTSVYTETTAAQTIPAESSVVFNPTGFFPVAEGDYTYEFTATIAETDEAPGNDTLTQTLTVSNDIYARDNNTIAGSLGIAADAAGILGQQFDITTATTLTSISGLIRNTDLSRELSILNISCTSVQHGSRKSYRY